MSEAPRGRGAQVAVGVALGGTLLLGLVLRAYLAGSGWLPGDWAHMRHAHSHLGWYGALFPLAFRAWSERGRAVPGRRVMAVYWLAVVGATVGFLRAGYGPLAIASSTLILGVWLQAAWQSRGAWREGGWFGAVPVSLVLGAASIGPVAAFVRRDPPLSAAWVQTFLTLLLFGVCLPAALERGGLQAPWQPARRRLVAPVHSVTLALAALHLGPLPSAPGRLALTLVGLGLVWSAARSGRARLDLRLGVAALGVGFALAAFIQVGHALAVAAIHFAILGPTLHALLNTRTGPLAWATQLSAALMGAGIVLATAAGLQVAAVAGGLTALGLLVQLARRRLS